MVEFIETKALVRREDPAHVQQHQGAGLVHFGPRGFHAFQLADDLGLIERALDERGQVALRHLQAIPAGAEGGQGLPKQLLQPSALLGR